MRFIIVSYFTNLFSLFSEFVKRFSWIVRIWGSWWNRKRLWAFDRRRQCSHRYLLSPDSRSTLKKLYRL